ncbi:MAG: IclR family transcriptional regulator [Nakamurella sp.]
MSNEAPARDSAVQSVDRAVSALEYLAQHGEARVSEVAVAIDVHKSTASRLLTVLLQRGLVEVAGERGRYRLGFGLVRLAGAVGNRLDVVAHGRDICDALVAATGETVNLAVRRGDQVFNLHQSAGDSAVAVNWVGRPTPLHATSSGKVLLAWGAAGGGADLSLEEFTARTVTDRDLLARQLSQAREQGWAATLGEYEDGLNAIAAPVFNLTGAVIAALSVSGPSYRLTESALTALAATVRDAAARLSERLGHVAVPS